MKRIYLDYAATTPLDPSVIKTILPYLKENFGNSASLHYEGRKAKKALEEVRDFFANKLKAQFPEEIIFTSSATESNNLAIKGVAYSSIKKGKHILISPIEHSSVLKPVLDLKQDGFEVEFLSVNREGVVDLKDLERKIRKDTILVSINYANNEIGTIQPIKEIGEICQKKKVLFHTDAAQAFGKIPINVKNLKIDLLTASSHKIYGPKGVGLLYIKKGIKIKPLLLGGDHEFGLRASTVNVPLIVGFKKAFEISLLKQKEELKKFSFFRKKIAKFIQKEIKGVHLTGSKKHRLNNILSFWFEGIEGEALMMLLDEKGIAVSTGSACASLKLEPSHVLLACGYLPYQAHSSLRVSFGRFTTEKEIDVFLKALKESVLYLRKISPLSPSRLSLKD
jgi:cysteine desulfurase